MFSHQYWAKQAVTKTTCRQHFWGYCINCVNFTCLNVNKLEQCHSEEVKYCCLLIWSMWLVITSSTLNDYSGHPESSQFTLIKIHHKFCCCSRLNKPLSKRGTESTHCFALFACKSVIYSRYQVSSMNVAARKQVLTNGCFTHTWRHRICKQSAQDVAILFYLPGLWWSGEVFFAEWYKW